MQYEFAEHHTQVHTTKTPVYLLFQKVLKKFLTSFAYSIFNCISADALLNNIHFL